MEGKNKNKFYAESYISVREFANSGEIISKKFKQPVSESYIYRLIRKHERGEISTLPFDYYRIGQILRIKV